MRSNKNLIQSLLALVFAPFVAGQCSVCGDGLSVTKSKEIFAFPGQPVVECGQLETAGKNGFIPLNQCGFLPPLIKDTCGCEVNKVCSVCGDGKEVSKPDGIFAFPGQPVVTCGALENAGRRGIIPLNQCGFLTVLIEDLCGCIPESQAIPQTTQPVSGQITVSTLVQTPTTKVTDLSNGAIISLDITNPSENTTMELEVGQQKYPVSIIANAQASVGEPNVHYIYILDTSGSTKDDDGACGTVLECMQSFFHDFHRQIEADKSAKLVSLIQFDTYATVEYELRPATAAENLIEIVNNDNIIAFGDTCCSCALDKARELAIKAKNQVDTTVVIFAGDGTCHDDVNDIYHSPLLPNNDTLSNHIEAIAETGAVIHTIAVGDDISCTAAATYTAQMEQNPSYLSNIASNGGRCFDIPDSNNLPSIIDDLTLTSLTAIEVKVDNNDYQDVSITDLTADALPVETGDLVTYSSNLSLGVGDHEICVRVSGKDISGLGEVEDCRTMTVLLAPTNEPTIAPTETPTENPTETLTVTPNFIGTGLPVWDSEHLNGNFMVVKVIAIVAIIAAAVFLSFFILKFQRNATSKTYLTKNEHNGVTTDKKYMAKGTKSVETVVPEQTV